MKVRNFILGAVAALMSFVSCQDEVEQLDFPKLYLDVEEMNFDIAGGEQSLSLTSTRNWHVECDADWIVVSPEKGNYSNDGQTVTISVLPNNGMDREAAVKFTIDMINRYVTVRQRGPEGSAEQLILFYNNFDKEEATKTYGSGESWPYLDQFDGWKNETGTGVANISYASSGMSARANSTSNSNYSDYSGSGSNNLFFGSNAYFAAKNIALGGRTDIALSFGTEKYSQSNGSIFLPSEFHIFLSQDGNKWVEFKDYTFAGGNTEGRWNVASAVFSVPSGTENLSICMQVDVASSYRMDDLRLEVSASEGTVVDFSNAKEMDFSAGSTGGGGNQGGGDVGTPSGNGTAASPYNVAAVLKKYQESGVSDDIIYVKGIISEFKGDFPAKYNSADIYISDDGSKTNQFFIFHGKDFDGAEFSAGDLKVGDKVVFKGKLKEYEGNPQLGSGELISLNDSEGGNEGGGNEGGGNQGGGEVGAPSGNGTEASPYNVAAVLKKYQDSGVSDDIIYVKGIISEFKGDFPAKYNSADIYISDDGTTSNQFFIFHGKDFGGVEFSAGDLKIGDKVVFKGKLKEYEGNPQLGSGELVSLNGNSDGGNEGGGNEGGENPPAGDAGEFDCTINWTLGTNAYDVTSDDNFSQSATVNGVAVNNLLKLGTGSRTGDATLHIPADTKKIGAYVVAWNKKTATLKASVNGTEVASIKPASNTGAAGNPPYTITVSESDYYEIEVDATSAIDVKVETVEPANGRVLIIGLKAIK